VVIEPTKPVDPEHAKHIERGKVAAWNQLAAGTPDERSVPTNVRLPPNIVQALEKAWQDTLATPTAHEQGGSGSGSTCASSTAQSTDSGAGVLAT
jgi:hypothetical protein